jgi:hypothetical protein
MTKLRKRLHIFIFPLAVLMLCSLDASAQDKVLGFRAATKYMMSGSITVKTSAPPVRRIKFRSTLAAVRITNVRIDYRDGTTQRVGFDKLIGPGMESDPIDLAGGERRIKRIRFSSVAISFKGRNALIFVYGED